MRFSASLSGRTAQLRNVPSRRTILFLQGPLSPLFGLVADDLARRGHRTLRINLCSGDAVAWGRRPSTPFRGGLDSWPGFVGNFMAANGVTDVVMHSGRRAYHREAIRAADRLGANVIVTELGYLRPDWMTIEAGGNGIDSLFPNDPERLKAISRALPDIDFAPRYVRDGGLETIDEIKNSFPNTFLWFLYPHYRRHGLYHPFTEYRRWLWRETRRAQRTRAAERTMSGLEARGSAFFVFAMQVDSDFQIRDNSQFGGMHDALEFTLDSFSRRAPAGSELVVKSHPIDVGPTDWRAAVTAMARRLALQARVHFVDALPLPVYLRQARGVVTVNSSAGLEALEHGVPVKVLSPAIYEITGLTTQATLDDFWADPVPPDAEILNHFRRALAGTVQVRGSIYSREGRARAAAEMAERIAHGQVNEPGGREPFPPRLRQAVALGLRQTSDASAT